VRRRLEVEEHEAVLTVATPGPDGAGAVRPGAAVAVPTLPPPQLDPVLLERLASPDPARAGDPGADRDGRGTVPDPPSMPLRPVAPVAWITRLPPPPALASSRSTPSVARRRTRRLAALAVVAGVVALAALQAVQRNRSVRHHPRRWDPRLVELVRFVEHERGLVFRHPVQLDVLPAEAFAAATDVSGLGAPQRQSAATTASRLRSLGLLAGDVDLLDVAHDRAPLAHYDAISEHLMTRESGNPQGFGATQRVALVHELTHALQDQYFDLAAAAVSTAPRAAAALIDGDARRIQRSYVTTLTAEEQAAVAASDPTPSAHDEGPLSTLAAGLALPMVDSLIDLGGQAVLDGSLQHLPLSEEALLDPGHYRGSGSVLNVIDPVLAVGETVVDQGTLGSLTWYLMLAEVTDPATALRAAYGWGADRYVLARNGEQTCLHVAYVAESRGDLNELRSALEAWVAAAPGVRRELGMLGDQLLLTGCDPGSSAPVPRLDGVPALLDAPAVAVGVASELYRDRHVPFEQARCAGIAYVAWWSGAAPGPEPAATVGPEERSRQLDLAVRACP